METITLEFHDGKLILSEISALKNITWEKVKKAAGICQSGSHKITNGRCYRCAGKALDQVNTDLELSVIRETFKMKGADSHLKIIKSFSQEDLENLIQGWENNRLSI